MKKRSNWPFIVIAVASFCNAAFCVAADQAFLAATSIVCLMCAIFGGTEDMPE